ncbi:MAG: hypothetical protein MZV65_02075 [Chromatiales bacterium]|nr:hypothetical protein [Chromatiales bacterium]
MFTPIQVAAIAALEGPQDCVAEIREMYQQAPRRAVRRPERARAGRSTSPRPPCSSGRRSRSRTATLGSLEFSKKLLAEAKVAVSPGIGFGEYGDDHVRFAPDRERASHPAGAARHPARCSARTAGTLTCRHRRRAVGALRMNA